MRRFEVASLISAHHLVEVWNSCLPSRFAIDEGLFVRLGRDDPNYLQGSSLVLLDGDEVLAFVEMKSSPSLLYSVADPNLVHIHSLGFRNISDGVELLQTALEGLEGSSIAFGTDNGHFWPGVPVEWREGFRVLEAVGFKPYGGEAVDVEADLGSLALNLEVLNVLDGDGVEFRRGGLADFNAANRFLEREFPGRWHFDVMCKMGSEPRDVLLLWMGEEVEGFAFTQSWKSTPSPIAGCVWCHDLGDCWGGLGPIGVSKSVRGQGFGGAVLVGALRALQESGVRRCAIDWTTLVDFYGKYGFKVSRRYQGMRRS